MREETLVKNLLQYKRVLEGMLHAMVGNPTVAEDLFQEMAILMTRKRDGDEKKKDGPRDGDGKKSGPKDGDKEKKEGDGDKK